MNTLNTFTSMQFSSAKQLVTACLIVFCSLLLQGCMKSAKADFFAKPLAADLQQTIENNLQNEFRTGSWRYNGLSQEGTQINAFIQIPEPLAMSAENIQVYIQKAVCARQNVKNAWEQLSRHQLAIHLYTSSKNKSVYATCHSVVK